MSEILLVTGNNHKLQEWQRLTPPHITLNSINVELEELQSDDSLAIVTNKVKRAYAAVGSPVIVEDVSAGLVHLEGLPGPFIKYFIKKLGQDALYQLAGRKDGTPAVVSCSAAYYDGKTLIATRGEVHGTVVAPRGDSFGFDITFIPDGHSRTYGEMKRSEKDAISHRSIAVKQLFEEMANKGML